MKHKPKYPPGAKTVQLFAGAPDGHATFTTLLRLDASSAMMSRVLHYHLTALDALLVLRSKPVKSAAPDFKVKSVKPLLHAMHGMAHRCQRMSGLRQALTPSSLSRSRRTGSLLELAIAFFLDLIDAVFITISPSIYSCSNRAPCGPPMTPSELLGSLGGGAKAPLVLHHHMMHRRQAFLLACHHRMVHRIQAGARPSPRAIGRHVASYTCTSRAKRNIKCT